MAAQCEDNEGIVMLSSTEESLRKKKREKAVRDTIKTGSMTSDLRSVSCLHSYIISSIIETASTFIHLKVNKDANLSALLVRGTGVTALGLYFSFFPATILLLDLGLELSFILLSHLPCTLLFHNLTHLTF